MGIVHAILPLPPGINASYKTGNGKFYGSPELKAFKENAFLSMYLDKHLWDWDAIAAIKESEGKTPLSITIDIYFPTRWKRDIDGPEKAAIDAVFNYIGLNDNLIVDKHTRKLVDRAHPRVEIAIRVAESGVTLQDAII